MAQKLAGDYALAEPLMETAWRAGRAIMAFYAEGDIAVEHKTDRSPVTAADKAAEDIILRDLARLAPDTPVVSEEAAGAGRLPKVGARFFLVDPLDGTKEFISRNGEFTVNIALVEQGRPKFGLVYAPALGKVFVTLGPDQAALGMLDAQLDCFDFVSTGLAPIHVRQPPDTGLVALGSRSHMNDATRTFLQERGIVNTRSAGSSLKFCDLARGLADVYPRLAPTMEWDTAAGHAVLLAAGGFLETEDGAPLAYGKAEAQFRNPGFIAWGQKPARA